MNARDQKIFTGELSDNHGDQEDSESAVDERDGSPPGRMRVEVDDVDLEAAAKRLELDVAAAVAGPPLE